MPRSPPSSPPALGVARRDVRLASGERSRAKRFEIRGACADPQRLLDDPGE